MKRIFSSDSFWKKWFFILMMLLPLVRPHASVNLFEQRIREVSPRKKNIYLSEGIFHKKSGPPSVLKEIRNGYSAQEKRERLVFEFSAAVPRLYGALMANENKVRVDFMDTSVENLTGNSNTQHFLKGVHLYPVEKGRLSIEIDLTFGLTYDIFYLDNPGRLVLDIKKQLR